jgi:hypothetical protein
MFVLYLPFLLQGCHHRWLRTLDKNRQNYLLLCWVMKQDGILPFLNVLETTKDE